MGKLREYRSEEIVEKVRSTITNHFNPGLATHEFTLRKTGRETAVPLDHSACQKLREFGREVFGAPTV